VTVSTYLGLDTALSALQADQEALDTTSNNIANASTPGYTQERVDFSSTPAYDIPGGYKLGSTGIQIGTGVAAGSITRVRGAFLDGQYRTQNAAASYASEQTSDLGQAQAVLGEPSAYGISSQLGTFWSAWGELANNPTSTSARQAVVDAGGALVESFNTLSSSLTSFQSQINANYASITGPNGQVQSDATQIANLNTQIAAAQAGGQTPNTLLDQRDQVLDNLSSLAGITVANQPNGMVSVQFGDAATPLIDANNTVTWPQTLTAAAGGQLGAMLNVAGPGGQIAGYETQLDNAANTLITSVNSLSSTTPFFSGNSASTIAVAATPATV
jgi:flagellar hook-associated protein 1 FlgK